jgi:hypothetical protein
MVEPVGTGTNLSKEQVQAQIECTKRRLSSKQEHPAITIAQ